MNEKFNSFLRGKNVALVGNATPSRDCSAEIDAHDIVVRMNHFYNFNSGKVGKRIDAIIQTPTMLWLSLPEKDRNKAEILRAKPKIFLAKNPAFGSAVSSFFEGQCEISALVFKASFFVFTTGTVALALVSDSPAASVSVYGISFGEKWDAYLRTSARHYAPVRTVEEAWKNHFLKKLKKEGKLAHVES